jgi:hypothetical protein
MEPYRVNARARRHTMSQPATVERFTRVDATVDPRFFVRFVDAANEMASVLACKRRMEALLQPQVG